MPFCVLGMHRSGTSVVTRLLHLLGMSLGMPDHLMPPSPENPRGYWENQLLTDLNEEILARMGGTWDHPPPLPDGWADSLKLSDLRQKAKAIVAEEFEGESFWGWKDPRNSITLPFWQQVVPELRYVICVRNPSDVANSLSNWGLFSRESSSRLWSLHMRSAILSSAGSPRIFVFYESLVEFCEEEFEKIADFAEVRGEERRREARETFRSFVDRTLWHHRSGALATLADPEFDLGAKALYVLLRCSFDRNAFSWNDPTQELAHHLSLAVQSYEEYQRSEKEKIHHLQQTISRMYASQAWRFACQYRRFKNALFPANSLQRKALDRIIRAVDPDYSPEEAP